MYWNGKVDLLKGPTLPKIGIISKHASNKSFSEINFVKKTQLALMSTFHRSEARGSKDRHLWNTKVVQKVRYLLFFIFFFRLHWNELPKGECSGGLYDYSVKIWRLFVCFSLFFSLVRVKFPVADAPKFEICVVIHFLHAEGQPAVKILLNWSLKIKNEMSQSPSSMNWAELNF